MIDKISAGKDQVNETIDQLGAAKEQILETKDKILESQMSENKEQITAKPDATAATAATADATAATADATAATADATAADATTATTDETDATANNHETAEADEGEAKDEMTRANAQVSLLLALFGGSGVGMLFGVIMGTSITPTVATIFGALTGLLAGILGLNDINFSNAKAVRVGSFGFACVFGAYLGIFVRTHNLLSPSLLSLKQQYVELGFSEAQALDFIAQKEFGVSLAALGGGVASPGTADTPASPDANSAESVEEGAQESAQASSGESAAAAPVVVAAVNPSVAAQIHQQHSSLLFSAYVDLSSCDELEGTDDTLPLNEIINNFELTGEMWKTAALLATEQINPEQQKAVMLATKDAICSSGKINGAACEQLKPLAQPGSDLNYQQLFEQFNQFDEGWKQLATAIDRRQLSEADKQQSLLLITHILCES